MEYQDLPLSILPPNKGYISVLGLNSGYTVKYTALPSRVPLGFAFGGVYLTVYPSSRPNTDKIKSAFGNDFQPQEVPEEENLHFHFYAFSG